MLIRAGEVAYSWGFQHSRVLTIVSRLFICFSARICIIGFPTIIVVFVPSLARINMAAGGNKEARKARKRTFSSGGGPHPSDFKMSALGLLIYAASHVNSGQRRDENSDNGGKPNDASPGRNIHKTFTKLSQNLHKTFTEPSQNLHKTFVRLRRRAARVQI